MYAKSRHVARQSQNFTKRRKNRAIILSSLVILCLASWIFAFVRFTRLDALNIVEAKITGVDAEIVPSLQAAVLQSLSGNYLGILPKSNTLIFSKEMITDTLKSVAPNISSVSIVRDGGRAIDITVTEKAPTALVCTGYPDFAAGDATIGGASDTTLAADEDCYYADSTGYIFESAPTISGNMMHKYYVPLLAENGSTTTRTIGLYATSTAEFAALERFYSDVLKSGLSVQAILMKDAGEYEMYVENPSKDGIVVIYFNNVKSFKDEYENLISFWTNMTGKSKSKATSTALDYIDVRYGANVFYK